MLKSVWSVATHPTKSARSVAAADNAATARRRRMSKCDEKLSPSIQPIESLETDPHISIEIRIQKLVLRSGPATLLIARILQHHILRTVVRSLSSKGVNRGEEVIVNATVHFLYSHDREPARLEPARWMAV